MLIYMIAATIELWRRL